MEVFFFYNVLLRAILIIEFTDPTSFHPSKNTEYPKLFCNKVCLDPDRQAVHQDYSPREYHAAIIVLILPGKCPSSEYTAYM